MDIIIILRWTLSDRMFFDGCNWIGDEARFTLLLVEIKQLKSMLKFVMTMVYLLRFSFNFW